MASSRRRPPPTYLYGSACTRVATIYNAYWTKVEPVFRKVLSSPSMEQVVNSSKPTLTRYTGLPSH